MKRLVAPLFALLVLAIYADPLFFPRTFGGRDLPAYKLPMEKAVHDAYARGRLPVWAASVSGGRPLAPNPNAGALYPVRLLLAAVPFESAAKVFPVLHWILSGLGMALLLSASGASGGAQWIGAVTYAFSGIAVSEVFFPHMHPGMTLLPWILWAIRRDASRAARLLLLALLLGLDMLAADVFTVAMGLAAGILWIALEEPPDRRKRLGLDFGAAAGLGLLLAAPQIVATALWIPETSRAVSGMTLGESFAFATSPWRLLEFVVPFPFGDTWRLDEAVVWGKTLFRDKAIGLFSTLYCGALPVLALAWRRRLSQRGCRFARVLFLAGLAACVLPSLLPGAWRAVRSPIALRYPEKVAVVCVLALSILAGWAFDVYRRDRFSLRGPLFFMAALASGAAAAFLWPDSAGAGAAGLIGASRSEVPVAAASLAPALAQAGLFWALTLAALNALRLGTRVAGVVTLATLTFVPIAAGRRIAQTLPETAVFSPTSFAREISRADPGGRYRTLGESLYRGPSPLQLLCQKTDPTYTDYARRSWTQHTHALWDRGTVLNYDFDAGDLSRVESLRRVARNLSDSGKSGYLLGNLALRFGIRFRDQQPVSGYRRFGGDSLQDWDENPDAFPAVRLLSGWKQEPDGLAALKDIGRLGAGEAVLETGLAGSGVARAGSVRIHEDTPEVLRVETDSPDPGWLFVLRSFWTHRTVDLDGRPVEPVPAQLAFSAVAVPAGRHRIEWRERLPGASVSRWGPALFVLAGTFLWRAGMKGAL